MILQNLQFPETWLKETHLYFRYDFTKVFLDKENQHLIFKKNTEVVFNTYFNSFSYEKWKRYTIIDNLSLKIKLKGTFEVTLMQIELLGSGEHAVESVTHFQEVRSSKRTNEPEEFVFLFPKDEPSSSKKGLYAFKLKALEKNSVFYGGAYCTELDTPVPEVNLALCICAYNRDAYVENNLEGLINDVFRKPNSMLHNHLFVYVGDNGKTLSQKWNSTYIKIFPNINSGGAGGFSRGMIEAIKEKEKNKLTHFVLMDDDVVFTYHSLERAYMFLRMLKPENKGNTMLGGAMLRLDSLGIQHGAGETWRVEGTLFNKINYNMFSLEDILRNEIEEGINQLAWWFCCFPMDENATKNLSIPVFFQYDDFDFNQRNNHMRKVTVNGICLWHEPFQKKMNQLWKEYYAIRNRLIICALYGKDFTKNFVKKLITEVIKTNLMTYRYKCARLAIRAVRDWFKGFEYLTTQAADEMHREIKKSVYKLEALDKLPVDFDYGHYMQALVPYKENKLKRIIRHLTLNGMLLPASNTKLIVPVVAPVPAQFFLAKRALCYDEDTQTGFVVYKNIKEALNVLQDYRRLLKEIDKKFDSTVATYKTSYPQYVSVEFWNKYLGLE